MPRREPTVAELERRRRGIGLTPQKMVFSCWSPFLPHRVSSFFSSYKTSSWGNNLATSLLLRSVLCASIPREMLSTAPLQNENTAWSFPTSGALHTAGGAGERWASRTRTSGGRPVRSKPRFIHFGAPRQRTEKRLAGICKKGTLLNTSWQTNRSSGHQTWSGP